MKIGEDAKGELGRKDAFHVAAILMNCKDSLRAGDSVKILNATSVELCDRGVRHGVCDPFASVIIPPNTLVWVYLEPKIVGDLTHKFEINLGVVISPINVSTYIPDPPPIPPYDSEQERCNREGC